MTTEDEDSENPEERNAPEATVTEDVLGEALLGIEDAYSKAIEARMAASAEDRDDYVKIGIVLLALGKALKAKDSRALGHLASRARTVLSELEVDWAPRLTREDLEMLKHDDDDAAEPIGREDPNNVDPENVGGALLQDKDFAPRAGAHVKKLVGEPISAKQLGAYLARLVRSGPWARLCDSTDQKKNSERIAHALAERIDQVLGPYSDVKEILRVALEALGASKDEAKKATREI